LAEFSNPNQQGSQDNRSLVAMMVLMMVALFGYQYYRLKTNPQPGSPPAASGNASTAPSQPAPTPAPATAVSQTAAPADRPATPTVPVVQATAETSTIIENELYRITFSNRGGQVTSWVLKQLTRTPTASRSIW
jgi:YidC/Oxa1 family membrane protein insertase